MQPLLHDIVGEFVHLSTVLADRKGDQTVLVIMRMRAGHEGVDALQPVHEPGFDKPVECPVDLQGRANAVVAQPFEQSISAERFLFGQKGIQNQLLVLRQIYGFTQLSLRPEHTDLRPRI